MQFNAEGAEELREELLDSCGIFFLLCEVVLCALVKFFFEGETIDFLKSVHITVGRHGSRKKELCRASFVLKL